jgi:3-oxoacyl-[acyl-carrier-protein] synthase III
VMREKGLAASEVDFFMPHLSSNFFKSKVAEELEAQGIPVPEERWFLNLSEVGNVGSASIYLMVHDLVKSGRLKKGQKILLMVPESARFSYAFALLTVV